jgi:Mrp family chromosome partitioning ATPase
MSTLTRSKPTVTSPASNLRISGQVQDTVQTILRRLNWPADERSPAVHTVGVTSSHRREGVSTIAVQLAVSAASIASHPVLLVDTNLANPAIADMLGVGKGSGTSELLLEDEPSVSSIRPTSIGNLSVLAAGNQLTPVRDNFPVEAFARLVEWLRFDFRLIVFDLPPVDGGGMAVQLARFLDGILLVIEAERVQQDVARQVAEQLGRAEGNLLGAILNKRREYIPKWLLGMV